MKKAFTLIVLIVAPMMAFTQGTVIFQNQTGAVCFTSQTDIALIPVRAGYVQLIAASIGTPLANPILSYNSLEAFLAANPGWAAAVNASGAAPAIIGVAPGLFNGGTYTINGIPPGGSAEYFVVSWTGARDLDTALASGTGWMGESAIYTTATSSLVGTPSPPLPVSLRGTFGGIPGLQCLDPWFGGFKAQPANRTVILGATATFYVAASACPDPYYQWYFNGVSIPGATSSRLQIWNAQSTNAGTYWAVLSNAAWRGPFSGTVYVSASATLTVLEPPIITHQLQDRTAYGGSIVDFRTRVTGSSPLAYQWAFNGSAISGAVSTDLQLTNVIPTQAGTYTLVVSNVAGAATSVPAMLSVIPPVEQRMVPALVLMGQPGNLLHLDDADALDPSPEWVTFDSVTLTNTSQWYFDLSLPLPPQRFYRTWQAGGPSVLPSPDLKMVPAITLAGPVGSSVRVDSINQIGPTDAWLTLAAVALTNKSQLYFDVSAPSQPQRLYRLVQVP